MRPGSPPFRAMFQELLDVLIAPILGSGHDFSPSVMRGGRGIDDAKAHFPLVLKSQCEQLTRLYVRWGKGIAPDHKPCGTPKPLVC